MKSIAAFLLLIVLFGCQKEENERLKVTADSLRGEVVRLESDMESQGLISKKYLESIVEINRSLISIGAAHNALLENEKDLETAKGPELADLRQMIEKRISAISLEFQANDKRFKELRERTSGQLKDYKDMIDSLYQANVEQQSIILDFENQIREKLAIIAGLHDTIITRESTIAERNRVIADKEEQLSTRYFIVGGERELKKQMILEPKGGFLFGSVLSLVQPVKTDQFSPISIYKDRINVGHDIAELVPERPEGSYSISGEGTGTVLTIVDRKVFWQLPYLAIVTE